MDKSSYVKKQKGQLMVEAMVAVSLMLVGLLGIFGVLSRALGLARVAADQYIGVNLASEGIEVAKNILDTNIEQGNAWNFGFQVGTAYVDYNSENLLDCSDGDLFFDPVTGLYNCDGNGRPSKYSRELTITIPEGEADKYLKVVSTVRWIGRGGVDSEVSVEDHFYSWRDN